MHFSPSLNESKKIVHFIGFWPDYEQAFFYLAEQAQEPIKIFNPLSQTNTIPLFAKWPRVLRNLWHKHLISKYIKANQGLFVAHEHRLILEVLLAKFPQLKAHILMRNPLGSNTKSKHLIQSLQALDYTIWSFDPKDCIKYGFKPYRQFIEAWPEFAQMQSQYDFAFVGRNKGREFILQDLKSKLEQQGYSVLFDIRSEDNKSTKANLSYSAYLRQYLSAACMIDISQAKQTGLTLRPLEAMLYQRKLLTNNPLIKQEAFYKPTNVFILNEDLDLTELKAFMSQAFSPVAEDIQQLYSVGTLIQHLSQSEG